MAILVHLDWYRDADGSGTGRSLQWEMVLGLTDGQSLTAFIADPMICSHVIRQRQQPPEEDHLTSLAASVARQRNDENFLLRLVLYQCSLRANSNPV